jgi:hypothetical protein
MHNDVSFPAPGLVGFLHALDFRLQEEQPLLWADRDVAGENLLVAFYALAVTGPDTIREAKRALSKAGRSEPSAAMHLISFCC